MTVPPRQQFNLASALSGFAIGCVVTMLATIAIVPSGGSSQGGTPMILGTGGFGPGDASFGDLDEQELGEGEAFALDQDTGDVVVVDQRTGEVVRQAAGGDPASAEGAAQDGGARQAGRTGSGVALGDGTQGGGGSGGNGGGGGEAGDAECAPGRNGGATDEGITGGEIKLGATVAESGIARGFLGEVRQGMEAIRQKVNRAGGICGRQLRVVYVDDEWQADRGARFIANLVEGEKVFALAVSPSSEGLNLASNQGYFQRQGVPVVGADGLNATQFKDPMIWPVAAATTTTVNVMMKNAYDRCQASDACTELRPAIIFGNTYRFGVEGAFAANAAYQKLTNGKNIPGYRNPLTGGGGGCEGRFCGVSAGQGSYTTEVSRVKNACSGGPEGPCNFMILLLEPRTAQDWMAVPGVPKPSDNAFLALRMGAPQPLFTFDFGRVCGDTCRHLWVWTGYNPPIAPYQGSPAVQQYARDLQAQSGTADRYNQFTMGGYVGMQLLVRALEEVGPNLTRERLVQALDSMGPLQTGLTAAPSLQWRSGQRYANHSAQAFIVEVPGGNFSGWRHVAPPIRDPWLGQHAG